MKILNDNNEILADLEPKEILKIIVEEAISKSISKNFLSKKTNISRKRISSLFNSKGNHNPNTLELTKLVSVIEKYNEKK